MKKTTLTIIPVMTLVRLRLRTQEDIEFLTTSITADNDFVRIQVQGADCLAEAFLASIEIVRLSSAKSSR